MSNSEASPQAAAARDLLAALIRAALSTDEGRAAADRREAQQTRERLIADGLGSLTSARLDGLWSAAVAAAEPPELADEQTRASRRMPAICPVSLDEIADPGVPLVDLQSRIREAAATG